MAVISMAGRFPGAADVASFWRNLTHGVESISRFGLGDAAVDARASHDDDRFVGAEGVLDDIDVFANDLFGFTPRDAEITDPQHRVCLEVVWEALDTAGYVSSPAPGPVGVFLGATMSSYLVRNLLPHEELVRDLGGFRVLTRNDKDFLPATISYKLGLSGPSIAIGTSCSSSLVAVHVAAQSLLSGECDMAIGGGVSLLIPTRQGYHYRQDGIYSPDGHCRAFGSGASGTVGGSGVVAVVLKRLADAERDGDHVHAVLLGSAVNNDGSAKAGFTAPGVAGQAAVIAEAHAVSGVTAREVGLVEAHGTGTALGDMIEIEALTQAFRLGTADRSFCAIGSVKSNVGHLDAAAGAAGLVKAVLAVEHGVIPATLHADPPNPALDFPSTPFQPAMDTLAWDGDRRTAGVSAFGIGGTNAHAVVRQATADVATRPPMVPLVLSAVDAETLSTGARQLADWLEGDGVDADLAAVSRTLVSRSPAAHRLAVLAADPRTAADLLRSRPTTGGYRFAGDAPATTAPVLLLSGPVLEPDVVTRLAQLPIFADRLAAIGSRGGSGAAADEALVRTLLELGVPVGGLTGASERCALVAAETGIAHRPDLAPSAALDVTASVSGPDPDPVVNLYACVAALWAGGHDIDWGRYRRSHPGPRALVPARALRRRRCWIDPPVTDRMAGGADRGGQTRLDQLTDGLTASERSLPAGADGSLLDPLCAALALTTLRQAGLPLDEGSSFQLSDVHEALQVLPPLRRLADLLVGILVEDGLLIRQGAVYAAGPGIGDAATPDAVAAAVRERAPALAGMIELLRHCAASYPVALSRPGAALATLYPDGSGALLERTLGGAPDGSAPAGTRDDVGHAAGLLARLARRIQRSTPRLRVLEIGAGDGRLTRALAAELDLRRADYLVTDISRAVVDRLADRAADVLTTPVDLRFGVLDISTDPVSQGLAPGSFDLIVGLDVLHAVRDLPGALGHCERLLAPGGVLGIVETTARHRWLSMVFGLSAAWWHFDDDLRSTSPLLEPEGWRRAISDIGDEQQVIEAGTDAALVLARRSGAAPVEEPSLQRMPPRRPDPGDWCYLPGWRRVPPASVPDDEHSPVRRCLVLGDGPLAAAVVVVLQARGVDAQSVERRTLCGARGFSIEADRVGSVLDEYDPDAILYLYPACTEYGEGGAEDEQEAGLHGLVAVAQAVGRRRPGRTHLLLAATRAAQEVVGQDLHRPAQATVAAATAVMGQEYPALRSAVLDLPDDAGADAVASVVVDELLAGLPDQRVAVRGHLRWLPTVEPVPLPASRWLPRGLHVICGGTGGVGLALAEHLASAGAPVVLTGRTALPDPADWEAHLGAQILPERQRTVMERLRRISAAGGIVVYEQADVTDAERMREVLARATDRFGPLRGLVHAAGVTDPAGVLQRRTKAETVTALTAKLHGVSALAEVLAVHTPSFVVFCSSIGTVLSRLKFGEVGYLAGHEFLNAWAAHRATGPRPDVITIAWTDWVEAGMWARAREQLSARPPRPGATLLDDSDLLQGLTDAEGVDLFDRIVSHRPGPVVLVSTQPLDQLLDLQGRYESLSAVPTVSPAAAPVPAPRRSAEETIRAIWMELLGIDDVGMDDDFFELGGDSLVALRVLARIREETGTELPFDDLFEAPTVRELAVSVEAESGTESTDGAAAASADDALGELVISVDGTREEIVI
ncbi:SDR family NAD(P)-dependent oxidoreductase [Goekera deserti]|uniref:SDR family NAD(P)-dependent oxidoreductase n=1 Tax=Goekera deserti TaxID=2497753 RepID=A0A7K3WD05_9ACTN|nr:SDR family NAD(P)-dependent oxidoreductase [Goekera deserti]NDI46792.1 SDR family NAD(P)-dependent oxidoreductase [Goekera deserti]NEL54361.1 SDR family NAD(P)-dependent oxidoreductase [Goekera deserti]